MIHKSDNRSEVDTFGESYQQALQLIQEGKSDLKHTQKKYLTEELICSAVARNFKEIRCVPLTQFLSLIHISEPTRLRRIGHRQDCLPRPDDRAQKHRYTRKTSLYQPVQFLFGSRRKSSAASCSRNRPESYPGHEESANGDAEGCAEKRKQRRDSAHVPQKQRRCYRTHGAAGTE